MRVQQAARLQHTALGIAQTTCGRGHRLFLHFHGFLRRIQNGLDLLHRGLQRSVACSHVVGLRTGDPALPITVIQAAFHALCQNVFQRWLLSCGKRSVRNLIVRNKDQTKNTLTQLINHHGAQCQRVIARPAIGIAGLVNHYRCHTADGRSVLQFAILHPSHQHHQRVELLIGNHVR